MTYIHRHLEDKLLKLSRNFKIVLLKGARQVGKSTLIEKVFKNLKSITFDPVQDLFEARKDPDRFLDNFPAPLILDEIQYVPELIPAIKRRVDKSPQKGQYIITGSQNISIIRNISESLAGRVGILELEGMTAYEIADQGERHWLEAYLKSPNSLQNKVSSTLKLNKTLYQTVWQGSFPATLDFEEEFIPDYFKSYMQTYIERDVRMFADISDLSLFSRFVSLIAAYSAQEINKSQLGRDLGLSPKQASKWLDILIYGYQWREVIAYSNNLTKRVSKKPKGYFMDTGLLCYLQRISSAEALAAHPLWGALFETFCINMIFRLAQSLKIAPSFYHWRSNGGAEIDLLLEIDAKFYPIEIKAKSNLTKHDARGILAFRESYPKANIEKGLILYTGEEAYSINDEVLALPWRALLGSAQ
ncbi:MAG: ATP-binding protein [Vampirovibrionia bacterium]